MSAEEMDRTSAQFRYSPGNVDVDCVAFLGS